MIFDNLNKAQHIVLVLYGLLVAYCCAWVPWVGLRPDIPPRRVGYGWLWVGPPDLYSPASLTAPDYGIVAMRLILVTAICAAAFVLAGIKWRTERDQGVESRNEGARGNAELRKKQSKI